MNPQLDYQTDRCASCLHRGACVFEGTDEAEDCDGWEEDGEEGRDDEH